VEFPSALKWGSCGRGRIIILHVKSHRWYGLLQRPSTLTKPRRAEYKQAVSLHFGWLYFGIKPLSPRSLNKWSSCRIWDILSLETFSLSAPGLVIVGVSRSLTRQPDTTQTHAIVSHRFNDRPIGAAMDNRIWDSFLLGHDCMLLVMDSRPA
jgi:hypothetical protein